MSRTTYFVVELVDSKQLFCGIANEEYVDASAWTDDVDMARRFITREGAERAMALILAEPWPVPMRVVEVDPELDEEVKQ